MNSNQDMLNELKAESAELVERLSNICLEISICLEQGRRISRSEIDDLFRTLHSLKGLSGLANSARVVAALHLMEDRLTNVREGTSELNVADIESLAEAQCLLEKIFADGFEHEDEELLSALEDNAREFNESKTTTVDGVHCSASDQRHLDPLSLTDAERQLWKKYQDRDEFIFVVSSDGSADDCRVKIDPIGDVIIARTSGSQFLFVFAAELDQSLVESIVELPVKILQKEIQALASLGSPWTTQTGIAVQDQVSESNQPAAVDAPRAESSETESENADPEMIRDFLANANELLENLTQSLLELESNPGNSETVENIFRAAHTIKGTAGMLGFSVIEKLCHAIENTFDRLRKGQLTASANLVDHLLVGWDKVRELFALLERGQNPVVPIDAYLSQLTAAERGESSSSRETVEAHSQAKESVAESQQPASAQKSDAQATLRVDLKRLDVLVNLVGELAIDRTRFARIEEAMRTGGSGADLTHQMAESLLLFGRHMNEVQNLIMRVRMVPVGNVFHKFSRLVRDLSRQVGKEVELVIEGGDTELDKTLVEEIGDPLVHLIRNSVDHGIESPEERLAKGKNRKGRVRLSASQQGNTIVIAVEDDGKGLDVEKIKAKAIKNGLVKETDSLTSKEIYNLIFEPGFSTAEKVTNISGRGVGMDVVKKAIQKLKGLIELDSLPDKGIRTIIKLPITLVIVPSLMVEVRGETFAIPLVNVIESIRIDPADIQSMGTSRFVRLRDEVIPLVPFAQTLGLDSIDSDFWYREKKAKPTLQRRRDRVVFVVIGVGHERLGLVVDRLVGQQEIVIKPLGRLLRHQSGLAGACVLGDGRVALVLDVSDVFGRTAVQRGTHDSRAS